MQDKANGCSDEQIVRILRETNTDTVTEVAKRNGVSEATIYAWRKKFGSMGIDEVRRLKVLEVENARLRKLLVDRDLEIEAMQEISAKKMVSIVYQGNILGSDHGESGFFWSMKESISARNDAPDYEVRLGCRYQQKRSDTEQ